MSKKIKRAKLIIVFLLGLLCAFLMTGCFGIGGDDSVKISNDKGGKIKYTAEDIQKDNLNGYYVHNKDNTYTPIFTSAQGFADSGDTDDYSENRFVWFPIKQTDEKKKISTNMLGLIPTVTKRAPLVAYFATSEDMIEDCALEKYTFLGPTFGCKVGLGDSGSSMYFITDEACEGTNMADMIKNSDSVDAHMQIDTINNSKHLPYKNIDTDINAFLGLDKNAYYRVGVYNGTKKVNTYIRADTYIFKSQDGITPLSYPYEKTDSGFFKVTLPENLENGYYYFAGKGMFKYNYSHE